MSEQGTRRPADEAMPQPLQEMLLALLVFNGVSGSVVAGILRAGHFDGIYRDVAAAALTYRAKYGKPPGRAHAEDMMAAMQPRGGLQRTSRILRQLEARVDEVNPEYAASRAREHVRRVAIKIALVEAGERYHGPSEGAVDDMEATLYRALKARADEGDAGTFLSDTQKGLAFLDKAESGRFYGLGIPELDRMRVGMTPGESILYLAAKASGKSWFCVHCGRQAVVQGARVVHVTLEMDEDRVTKRYYQTFLGIAQRDDTFPFSTLITEMKERSEYAVGWKTREKEPRANFDDPKIRLWIRDKIKPWGTRLGRLVVKRFASGSLTLDQLRGYLDYLDTVHHFVPDVLIVDYPDLMKVGTRDFRIDLGRLYVELRGLGVDRSMAVVLPTQTNRSGLNARRTDATMVAEDKTKLDTADVVLTYSQTKQERARGLARLGLEYSRYSERGHVIVMTQSYPTGQYVVQSALQSGAYWDAVRAGSAEDDDG